MTPLKIEPVSNCVDAAESFVFGHPRGTFWHTPRWLKYQSHYDPTWNIDLSFVVKVASEYRNLGLPFEDLS